ncbi:PQQ-dependent sugar dehydrogenase [Stackebrandtia nassauensis]|uniref:Glucose sorbosone dehydrogenase n=1 Tax=Stackebrandtia nassauensis (strain DSM 44728 / CIP 108903 / NRRL B-16338 / NBRC 102104 / LLR-40K-21) TaxID=446470 RepID=D3Q868_STANL|nr:PQQ-dependent sugar dehydrogenase [Stackebrandtia nassauensis]ADD42442.1 glucose sorbosone dehydrogenase [Stackebrandtia nassauensis DSM 44728]
MNRRTILSLTVAVATVGIAATGGIAVAHAETEPDAKTGVESEFDFSKPEVMAEGLKVTWGMAYLPNGEVLFTQREKAEIYRMKPGHKPKLVTKIKECTPGSSLEAGLTGIAVSPDYKDDGEIFIYYTAADGNRIASLSLKDPEPESIVTGIPTGTMHDGGRLRFGPDDMLYATTGDTGKGELAQDPDSLAGKILRMEPDGDVPDDNPFEDSLVYSLGHRNVQGLDFDSHGQPYASELGLDTADEVNKIEAGGNYGWPKYEGPGGDPDYIDPIATWTPAEASPAGMAIADETLYVGALRGQRLWMVSQDGETQDALVGDEGYGRLRAVEYGPDGYLWVATSDREQPNGDMIVRFPPKK